MVVTDYRKLLSKMTTLMYLGYVGDVIGERRRKKKIKKGLKC